MKDLSVLIFFYMVQALLMILAGTHFFNIKVSKKKIAVITIIFGSLIWTVRYLYEYFEIPFGTHTLILAVFFVLIVKIFIKIDLGHAVGISLISLCLAMLGNGICVIILKFIPFTYEEILKNQFLHILFGHLENLVLILFLIIIKIYDFKINIKG